ncbi:hypothetical protein [Streptomyces sp. NPDC048191]|uniref:hypothetical protein n=1 Tax=Streptomyces sp. NPDC048191 TaxID=3155484 RepID=UPI0033C48FED
MESGRVEGRRRGGSGRPALTFDLVDWPSIAAGGFFCPESVPASRLADELSAMLSSPDPEVRDAHAYTAAARWIREGHLDDVLEVLGDSAASRFTRPEVHCAHAG